MILVVAENCPFCKKFEGLTGLVMAKSVVLQGKEKWEVGGTLLEPPIELHGLPTLLDGADQYIGLGPVEEHLKKQGLVNA